MAASDTTAYRRARALVCDNLCSDSGTVGPAGPIGPTGPAGTASSTGATGPQGLTGPTGPIGPTGTQGVAGSIGNTAIGSYYSTQIQPISVPPAAETIITYNNTGFQRSVSLASSTQITVGKTAVYEAYYSLQIDRTSGGSPITIFIWLKKNGSTVPDTNSSVSVNSNNERLLPYVPYILSLNAGDYIEFAIQATDINTRILAETSAIGPGIPSVIVGIKEIG